MIERLIINVFNRYFWRYSREKVKLTASKVESCEDKGNCYCANLSWSQIARDLDFNDYQQQNITVAVMIKNSQGTTSQQLTIIMGWDGLFLS